MFRSVITCLLSAAALCLNAQESGEAHTFTDKSGKQVQATLLSVSEDRRTMKIRREDGMEFDLVINVLSLDDQQFIKDHLSQVPVEQIDYRLEMDISRKAVNSESHSFREGLYTLKQEFLNYTVTVRNLSRETLSDARIEWAIAWDDRVEVFEEDGEWTYDRKSRGEENPAGLNGESALSSIPFNQEVVVTTGEVELNQVLFQGEILSKDENPHEDFPKGVIARVVSKDGTVLAESRLGGAEFDSVSWEDAIALATPRPRN